MNVIKVNVIKESDFPQFISTSSHKTPRCLVTVSRPLSALPDTYYEIPPGFQFDRYLSYLFPNNSIIIKYNGGNLNSTQKSEMNGEDGVKEVRISIGRDYIPPSGWEAEICDKYGTIEIHSGLHLV